MQTRPSSEPHRSRDQVTDGDRNRDQPQKCASATLAKKPVTPPAAPPPTPSNRVVAPLTVPVIQLTPAQSDSPVKLARPATPKETAISVPDHSNKENQPARTPPPSKSCPLGAPTNYVARRTWITTERMNELRRKAQDAAKQNKIFTIRGCFNSVRNALLTRVGWKAGRASEGDAGGTDDLRGPHPAAAQEEGG